MDIKLLLVSATFYHIAQTLIQSAFSFLTPSWKGGVLYHSLFLFVRRSNSILFADYNESHFHCLAETPPATTTDTTTSQVGSTSSADKRTGLTMGEMWAIIGACLAVLLIVVIIIIVVCCCKKKKGSGGGATKSE